MVALAIDIQRIKRKQNICTWPEAATAHLMEDTMELLAESVRVQPASRTTSTNPCTHSRAIDDVLTRGKKRSGKVRCLECQAIFDDPYQGHK